LRSFVKGGCSLFSFDASDKDERITEKLLKSGGNSMGLLKRIYTLMQRHIYEIALEQPNDRKKEPQELRQNKTRKPS
jgi:hypothetical protein